MEDDKVNSKKRKTEAEPGERIGGPDSRLLQELSREDMQGLVEELQVFQEQLNTQNEDLRQAQEELLISNERFSDLYDFAPVGYLTVDSDGIITRANLAASSLFQVDRGVMVRRHFLPFVYSPDRPIYFQHLRGAASSHETRHCELRLQRSDGTVISARLQSQPDPGQADHIMTAIMDITDLKKAEGRSRTALERVTLLSRSAVYFIRHLLDDDFYQALADQVNNFFPESICLANEYDPRWNQVIIRGVAAAKPVLAGLAGIFGRDPIGLEFRPDGNFMKVLMNVRLHKLDGGIREISFNTLPSEVARRIEKDLEIKDIYAVPLVADGVLLGTLVIVTTAATPAIDSEFIESFAYQATVAIRARNNQFELLRLSGQYRNIFENAALGIHRCDALGRIMQVNPAMAKMLGYDSVREMKAMVANMRDLHVHPERFEEFRQTMFRDGQVSNFQSELLCKGGGHIWVSCNARAVCDATGAVASFEGIVTDITERRKSEEQRNKLIQEIEANSLRVEELAARLQQERDILRIIKENANAQMAYLDSNYNLIDLNTSFARHFGREREELIGRNLFDFVNDENTRRVFDESVHSGKLVTRQGHPSPMPGADAARPTYWNWTLTPIKDDDGRVLSLVFSLSDVTEQMRLERVTEEARIYAEAIVDTVRIPLVVLDSELRIISANKPFHDTFRISPREIRGTYIHELGRGHWNISPLLLLLQEVIPASSQVKDYLVESEFPEIGARKMLLNATQLQQKQGGPRLILLSIEDITERMKMEELLRSRNAELAAANRELEAFSYSTSHDLRAPLRSIDGFSLALMEDYSNQLDEKGKDYLQRVRKATQRMAGLIDDLLVLSRVTRAELRRERIDLSALAVDILGELKTADQERQVETIIQPDIIINGDPRLIRIALQNLLSNAWKFTGQRKEAQIEFGAQNSDGKNTYYIRDNGAGFDMTYAGKLFVPFQRLHSATEFIGSGIGLAITERIIRRHGGTVWAESEVEKGATFYFTM